MRGNQFRTSDEDYLVWPKHAHGEIGILERRLANPHSDVEAFVDDVHAAIGSVERNAHSRMLGEEAYEQVGDAGLQKTRWTRKAHDPLWRGKDLTHGVLRRLRFIEERQAMAVKRLPCFGERETPRRAVYKAYTKLAFQRGDPAA